MRKKSVQCSHKIFRTLKSKMLNKIIIATIFCMFAVVHAGAVELEQLSADESRGVVGRRGRHPDGPLRAGARKNRFPGGRGEKKKDEIETSAEMGEEARDDESKMAEDSDAAGGNRRRPDRRHRRRSDCNRSLEDNEEGGDEEEKERRPCGPRKNGGRGRRPRKNGARRRRRGAGPPGQNKEKNDNIERAGRKAGDRRRNKNDAGKNAAEVDEQD